MTELTVEMLDDFERWKHIPMSNVLEVIAAARKGLAVHRLASGNQNLPKITRSEDSAKPLAADIEVSIAMLGQVVEDVKRGLANDESVMVIQEAATIIERQAAEGEALSKKARRYFAELHEAKAEIERQATEIAEYRQSLNALGDFNDQAQAEIERLTVFKEEYYDSLLEENLRLRKALEKAQEELDLEKKAHMSTARAFYEADENLSRSSGAQTAPRSPASKGAAEA